MFIPNQTDEYIVRLVLQTKRFADESWPSYLQRLAQHNYQSEYSVVQEICHELLAAQQVKDNLHLPTHPQTFALLAPLTWLSQEELYAATAHRLAAIVTPYTKQIQYLPLSNGLEVPLLLNTAPIRPVSYLKYCPYCLAEAAYQRWHWMPSLVTECVKHQCLLVDSCSSCHQPVSLFSIVNDRCEQCWTKLTDCKPVDLAHDELSWWCQQYVQTWLEDREPDLANLPPTIPTLSARAAYHVLDGLRRAVPTRPMSRFKHRPVKSDRRNGANPLYERHVAVVTAFKAFLKWPSGFFAFLRAYRRGAYPAKRDRSREVGGLAEDLTSVYRRMQIDWAFPDFEVVQEAFDEYLVENYSQVYKIRKSARYRDRPQLADRMPFLTYTEAARILQITPPSLTKLVAVGRLDRYRALDNTHDLFSRKEIEALDLAWSKTLTVSEAASLLGLSRRLVVDLVKADVLAAERGPSVDRTQQWRINERYIHTFLLNVSAHVIRSPIPEDADIDLRKAAQMLNVVELKAAAVLKHVANGELPAYYVGKGVVRPGALRFTKADIRTCAVTFQRENRWIDRYTVARMMRVKVTVVSKWVKAGLLTPIAICANMQHFNSHEVEDFVWNHVFTEQAAAMLGKGPLTIQQWARKGRLHPVSGPGIDECHRFLFRRDEIQKWAEGKYMTAPEMAKRLGISHSQLLERVKQGKIKPTSGPGVDGFKHYRFSRSQYGW